MLLLQSYKHSSSVRRVYSPGLRILCTLYIYIIYIYIYTISAPHAASWLRAIPNTKLGLAMARHEFFVALRLWLGLSVFSSSKIPRCICGQVVDIEGDHLLGCRQDPIRCSRHDAIRDIIWHALLQDDNGARKEQRCGPDTNNRPGDVFHPNFHNGRPAFFDVSVRNSFQPKFIQQSAITGGAAARAGEEEKDLRHEQDVVVPFSLGCGELWPLVRRQSTITEINRKQVDNKIDAPF